MKDLQAQTFEQAKKLDPALQEAELVALFASNLDPAAADRRVKDVTLITKTSLRVFREGEVVFSEALEGIESLQVVSGVGCALAVLRRREGAPVIFARTDSRRQSLMVRAVKSVNHYLRHGDTARSSRSRSGRLCPKCGKPYPRSSHSCPRCASKKKALVRLLQLASCEKARLGASIVFFFLGTAVSLLIPYINRVLVDEYIHSPEASTQEGFWIGFAVVILSLLGANLLRRVIAIGRGFFLAIAGNSLIVRLRDMIFAKIQHLSIAKLSERTSGELMKRVNSDTRQIKQFLVNQLPHLLEQSLLLVAVAGYVLFADWRLALLILIPAPFVALAFRLFWRFMRGLFNRRWQINAEGNAILHDIFSGIRVVKAYGMEKREEERFVSMAARERDAQLRIERIWAVLMPLLQFLLGIGEYVLLYYVGSRMLAGEMTAGQMTQFSAYAAMIFAPLMALMNFPRHFMHMMTSLVRVYEIMDEEDEPAGSAPAEERLFEGFIDINRVSFDYEDDNEVLRDVDLHIRPGEFIGLVGRSGVGKSTLINLIMRMYDVEEGSICIDGTDIREIPIEHLRSQMGVVLQENFLFTGTVWQNLTYAKPNATREEVIQAAKTAGAHEFIIRLPDGYNTYVGEKGYKLSGGERQRISIARALLHDPKILILDEATSALDTETEKLIQDALQALSSGRTTIAIAHRLSTLRNATRLVVLDKGMVAEVGSHEELMEKQGLYYGLVMAQREMTKMEV